MAQPKNYYEVLGVGESADAAEIRKAYRKLARKHHPDRNPGDVKAEERFKEIQEANEVLSDPQKRTEYDARRKNPFGSGGFRTSNGGQFYRSPDGTYVRFESGPGGGFGSDPLSDFGGIFDGFFGGRRAAPERPFGGRRQGSTQLDVNTNLRLSFDHALRGGKTDLTLPSGERLRINVPKGVASGFKIRLKGRGGKDPGGRRGDLYVTFTVEPHPDLRREGDDLFATIAVNPFEAMLGASRHVTNAYKKRIKVNIPAGAQHGDRLRLAKQGVETDQGKGDLYVEVNIQTPTKLTDRQRKIISDAAAAAGLSGEDDA